METVTYTRVSDARRAAGRKEKAGFHIVKLEGKELTFCTAEEWQAMQKEKEVEKKERVKQPEQNGVKMPRMKHGSPVYDIWVFTLANQNISAKELPKIAEEMGWNLHTLKTQRSLCKKYHGMGRAKK